MKKCVIIACYVNNQFRKELLQNQIKFFNELNIDVVLVSSNHIEKMNGVKNYITINHVSDKKYLTAGFFPYSNIEGVKYYSGDAYSNISASNFFVKLFQVSFNYCKNLGYDFCYVLDFDNIINKNHVDIAFSNDIDYSRIYFYDLQKSNEYQGAFFYGNLNVLVDVFSENNLNKMENLATEAIIITNEQVLFEMSAEYKEVTVVLKHKDFEIFSTRNMFSSRNVANVFYDGERKEYWFLQYKGDTCENEFACELFLEDTLIYSNHFKHTGYWSLRKLENNKNYKIKYYDAAISDLTLSKISNIYTDTNTIATPNWIVQI
jgi:hypothetical protein